MTNNLDSKRIIFGFSQKTDGNMKTIQVNDDSWQNIKKFCRKLANFNFSLVAMQQVHQNNIVTADNNDKNKIITGADGLLTSTPNLFLIAKAADCLPIIIYSENPKVVGIIHAGWKGTLLNISFNMINLLMTKFKVSSGNIFAIFGPSISSCCYEVKNGVFSQFQKFFNNDPKICQKYQDRMTIDLRAANYKQLQDAGVAKNHIYAPIYCTSCQNDKYFSYRKEKEKLAGEMAAVVAINT